MKKIVKYGWIGKNEKLKEIIYTLPEEENYCIEIAHSKKAAENWDDKCLPPKKVRITIEEV